MIHPKTTQRLISNLLPYKGLAQQSFLYVVLQRWVISQRRDTSLQQPVSHCSSSTDMEVSSDRLFFCQWVRHRVPLAAREELYHIMRMTGPVVSIILLYKHRMSLLIMGYNMDSWMFQNVQSIIIVGNFNILFFFFLWPSFTVRIQNKRVTTV